MSVEVPSFYGTFVQRITREPEGLALWVRSSTTGDARRFLLDEARVLAAGLPEGITRNEVTDALRLCRPGGTGLD
jgi:hypothetical protein